MKVLVIGAGGREHALCWKLKQSPLLTSLYCAPGNPGISELAECAPIKVDQISELVSFAKENQIDLTLVGPELPLTLGIVDAFEAEGLKVFGPDQRAAEMEGSKSFAKKIMQDAEVPTAAYEEFTDLAALDDYIDGQQAPLVLKMDGLAAGKGVFVCHDLDDAHSAARKLFQEFNAEKVLVEEFMDGVEASFIVATDGERIVPFASSHDYKRIYDEDQGPNTGGMGTVSPTPRLTEEQKNYALENIIKPVVDEMRLQGMTYRGFLYAGLMIKETGEIKVVEFNARFGDPEAQVVIRRMESDLLELILSLVDGTEIPEQRWSNATSVCVVLASEGYPVKSVNGDEISGIDLATNNNQTVVFHAGTKIDEDKLVTAGGRVLNVVGVGENLDQAIQNTYQASDLIQFRGQQKRRDIGVR